MHISYVDKLKKDFETIVPTDFGPITPIEVVRTMSGWPEKQSSDIGWIYVAIGGDRVWAAIIRRLTCLWKNQTVS
ncbi:hypothetical protein CSA56_00675 [candidate division KSB3 bacterium]|uniref:Uncharacterized protein n=1 Tax=candidate division KSB3 bacterium TaxID=2044937 RepID=A0A2G6KKY4_9BACT|nr:MAG: hypothetical protein CSA56_00675 [candidate division KSB3 bacterium]